MKLFKRIQALMLAIVMTIMTFGSTTAFAAETNLGEQQATAYSNASVVNVGTKIDQTFPMTDKHVGATRTYNVNTIDYLLIMSDPNGNPVNNIIALRCYDGNNNLVYEKQYWANGAIYANHFPVTPGGKYHFEYWLAYGTPTTISVNMVIVGKNY